MNDKRFYTEEQYRFARDTASALEYAQKRGYALKRNGLSFRLKEHDSMVFTKDGRWFWNSRGVSGGAIEFAMYYEHLTQREAVLAICDNIGAASDVTVSAQKPKSEKAQFVLPERSPSCRMLFAYLCKTRCLAQSVVSELVKKGDIYEGILHYTDARTGRESEIHNAVFVGRDGNGEARSAFQRGLTSFDNVKPFKMDVAGSNPAAPFCVYGKDGVDSVIVFEGAIDAISHASIIKNAGQDHTACHRIALGGAEKTIGLFSFLQIHPEVTKVFLAMDEDDAGRAATEKLQNEIPKEYAVSQIRQSEGKDWNDCLVARHRVRTITAESRT